MSLDEEPCGPSNTPEPGDRGGLGRPPTSVASTSDVDMDRDGNGNGDAEMDDDLTSGPMAVSPSGMLAQGRALEARFEELIEMHSAGDRAAGLEFGSETRDFAGFGTVL